MGNTSQDWSRVRPPVSSGFRGKMMAAEYGQPFTVAHGRYTWMLGHPCLGEKRSP